MAQLITMFREALIFKGHHGKTYVDDWVFQLFNKVTPSLYVLCSIMAAARQFFGEPIKCDAGAVRCFLIH